MIPVVYESHEIIPSLGGTKHAVPSFWESPSVGGMKQSPDFGGIGGDPQAAYNSCTVLKVIVSNG